MNNRKSKCNDQSLIDLLQAEDDGVPAVAEHLEHCQQCQARMEVLAADPQQWRIARQSLSCNQLDAFDDDDFERTWTAKQFHRTQSAWPESVVKQLLSPPSHPEMLGRIGRYEVERVIGSGGMGIVFKAFDTELNRPVAVKVLAPYLAGSGAARKRFAREARAAAAIVHEHVVPIHNVETDSETPFLVMHYVAGESLQQRLDREGPLELCEILRIGLQTAAGLAAAHAQGLVHRDVKPSNILLEMGIERTLLTDFGLARASDDASLTHTGYHPGTPQYMSPEQARGDSVDVRSDLFSLGSVLYAMCTGRAPFRADTSYGILRRITDTEPRPIREVNPAIPEWLELLIAKLHSKSPDDRIGSARELHHVLEQCLAHVQQPLAVMLPESLQQQDKSPPHTTKFARRSVATVCIGLLLLGVVGLALFPRNNGNLSPDVTQPSELSRHTGIMANDPSSIQTTVENPSALRNQRWQANQHEITELIGEAASIQSLIEQEWTIMPDRTESVPAPSQTSK